MHGLLLSDNRRGASAVGNANQNTRALSCARAHCDHAHTFSGTFLHGHTYSEAMVEAKHIGIVFIVAASLVVLVAFVSRQPGGWIETSKGSVCSWRTGGDASTNRVLKLDCKCFGKNGNEVEYSCEYVGVPQKTCSRYKTLIFEFFEQMLNSIKGDPFTMLHTWA